MAERKFEISFPDLVTDHLEKVYGLKVYTGVPQGFVRPSFQVHLADFSVRNLNSARREVRGLVSIIYHGTDGQDLWRMAADLTDTIEIIPVEGKTPIRTFDRTSTESDGSLVTTARFVYEILDIPSVDPMERLETEVKTEGRT